VSTASAAPAPSLRGIVPREIYTHERDSVVCFLRDRRRTWAEVAVIYSRFWYPTEGIVVTKGGLRKHYYKLVAAGTATNRDHTYDWMGWLGDADGSS